jgi:hypothetical protein
MQLAPSVATQLTEFAWSPDYFGTSDIGTSAPTETRAVAPSTQVSSVVTEAPLADNTVEIAPERATTASEEVAGEIRGWGALQTNWDGDGSKAPISDSLSAAAEFVLISDSEIEVPSPMLLASGHAGLFWDGPAMYADLEFIGAGQINYFIDRRAQGRHKGAVAFDGKVVPKVLATLLAA